MPNVRIRIERGQEQGGIGNQQQTPEVQKRGNVTVTSIFAMQMVNLTKQTISFAASNVGNFTGNYIQQDKIDKFMDAAGGIATIALGAASGGWVGAVVATIGVTTQKAFSAVTELRKNELTRRDIEYARARSGNTTNESRGTEN